LPRRGDGRVYLFISDAPPGLVLLFMLYRWLSPPAAMGEVKGLV
jgi:hypothetical protein